MAVAVAAAAPLIGSKSPEGDWEYGQCQLVIFKVEGAEGEDPEHAKREEVLIYQAP